MNEKWRKLTVKTELVQISDELAVTLSGLSFKELGRLAGYQDRKDFEGAMSFILFTSLRKALPHDGPDAASDEEIQNLIETFSGDVGAKIVQKVQELTGLSSPNEKK